MALSESETRPSPSPQIDQKEGTFDAPAVLTLSAAHMGHDTYASFLAPLLPLLIPKLGMSLVAAGALASIFRLGSLLQPFFGLWADRTDTRFFVILAPTVTAICMSLMGLAPNYLAIALMVGIAGVSAAAFHPTTAATVTQVSGRRRGGGSAVFMTGGKLGFALGPVFIVSLVTWVGLENSYLAAFPALLLSALLFLQLRGKAASRIGKTSTGGIWEAIKEQRRPILLLSGLVVFRSTSLVSIATFYPTYLTDRGAPLLFAGLALTVYEAAGSAGALVGGTVSDRLGRRTVLLLSQLISAPLLFLAITYPDGSLGLLLIGIAGAVATSSLPVELTLFQEVLPRGRSTAAGIWYLLSFEGAVLAAVAVGIVADWIGLGPTLRLSVLASLLCVPFTLALPRPGRSG